jgi:hypothetical protein
MKKLLAIILLLPFLMCLSGCGNMSPISRMNNEIENQGGQIQDLKELQNSMNAEIGNLHHQSEINADKIGKLQEGILNISNENSGFQMLTGSGGLIFAFATIVIVLMFFTMHYRDKNLKQEKALEILGEEIVKFNDLNVENEVFSKAMSAGVAKEMLQVIQHNQRKFRISP